MASALLTRSLMVLLERGEASLSACVTAGNDASEALLSAVGFVPVTPVVQRDLALGYYRAAAAISAVEVPDDAVLAASSSSTGATLWIIGASGPSETIEIHGTTVVIERVSADAPVVTEIARTAMPIRGAPWLLSRRG